MIWKNVSKDSKNSRCSTEDMEERASAKAGHLQVSGRFHRKPKTVNDDYIINRQVLGSGFNGDVKLATRKRGDKKVKFAVKVFSLTNVAPAMREQLNNEVEVFLCMDHPHIARLIDVYETEDQLYLVMECMDGGELFDRVRSLKRFSENKAADAAYQMLLALNYLHQQRIVHRDIKLENFLYDKPDSNHLKLIDFGFSRVSDLNTKMHVSCGTLSYVAPEVLRKSYTNACDLWSLGVVVFILLSGYMPFSGDEKVQTKNILMGNWTKKPQKWENISRDAKDFVKSLMEVDVKKRLTAELALRHPWITERKDRKELGMDPEIVQALRDFGQNSKFRRCCMQMMAWSLTNEERSKVREYFLAIDTDRSGTITLGELKEVMQTKFEITDDETRQCLDALDSNQDEEINYSDFLAAMVSTRISLHDNMLRTAFRKFDKDNSGYITVANLKEVFGDTCSQEEVDRLLSEADILKDNRISYNEFVSYIQGTPLESPVDAVAKVIDDEVQKLPQAERKLSVRATIEKKPPKSTLFAKLGNKLMTCCCSE